MEKLQIEPFETVVPYALGDVHRVSKTVPPSACHNFDTCERILIFFRRYVTDKVSNQYALYYATSNTQITCASALPGKTGKHAGLSTRLLTLLSIR